MSLLQSYSDYVREFQRNGPPPPPMPMAGYGPVSLLCHGFCCTFLVILIDCWFFGFPSHSHPLGTATWSLLPLTPTVAVTTLPQATDPLPGPMAAAVNQMTTGDRSVVFLCPECGLPLMAEYLFITTPPLSSMNRMWMISCAEPADVIDEVTPCIAAIEDNLPPVICAGGRNILLLLYADSFHFWSVWARSS